MLSNQSKYALRGVLYLAVNASKSNKYGSKEIGTKINIPVPFLAKIFQKLSKENVISSSKGPHGGFYLSDEQLEGNLLKVITCIDGVDSFNSCFIGLSECSDENPCPIHHLAGPLRNQLLEDLEKRSIAEFAADTKKGISRIF